MQSKLTKKQQKAIEDFWKQYKSTEEQRRINAANAMDLK